MPATPGASAATTSTVRLQPSSRVGAAGMLRCWQPTTWNKSASLDGLNQLRPLIPHVPDGFAYLVIGHRGF